MRRRTLFTYAAMLALAGCSSAAAPQGRVADPAGLLATARVNLANTPGVDVDMVGADIPTDISAVLTARGDATPAPAFTGRIKLQSHGVGVFIPIVAIKDDVWATLPWNDGMTKIDPAHYHSPNPAMFFDKDNGLATLLVKVQQPTSGDAVRSGDVVLRSITGTVPATDVHAVLGIGATTGTYDLSFGIDEHDRLITLRIEGPLFKGATSRYDVKFSDYGKKVAIAPPALKG